MSFETRFWWVNQNQTFEQEVRGGYLWSPKLRRDGVRHHYYETMREVKPGDVIFSFRNREIAAIGIALSHALDCPKPEEFGAIGGNWNRAGWRVDVSFTKLKSRILPRDHMPLLEDVLPATYSPLRANGNGIQNVYLTAIPREMAMTLAGLIGKEADIVRAKRMPEVAESRNDFATRKAVEEWEGWIEKGIKKDRRIAPTEKLALIKARRGQGVFRRRVEGIERACRITRVRNHEHLIGSHIKPWRDCEKNEERLDGENGLLLTPTIDHLFDYGFISFENNGDLLVSPTADTISLERMGVETTKRINTGTFSSGQKEFLSYHRDFVFLKSLK